jgi:hypothetical protein
VLVGDLRRSAGRAGPTGSTFNWLAKRSRPPQHVIIRRAAKAQFQTDRNAFNFLLPIQRA